jgi:hypothetical protein
MENTTYSQRLVHLILRGLRAGTKPALLINISFALLISIVIDSTEPNWDFTLRDGIFLTLLNTGVFIAAVFVGVILVGLILAIRGAKLLIIFLSFTTGVIPLIAANYALWVLFFTPSFRNFDTFVGQFLPLFIIPDISNLLVVAYAGRKMNEIGF